jgi:hypothetical protein
LQTETLKGASDYFAQMLKPNKNAFFNNASNFANALNLATSLFHFHEWLYLDFAPKLESEFNTKFPNKGAFWQAVQATDTRFGYIRDVANASKHVKIGEPGPANHGKRLAGFYLLLDLDKRSVGSVESSRKDRGNVKSDGWIASKYRWCVRDVELGLLQSPHVRAVGLIDKDGLLAEHRAGRGNISDRHAILDDLHSAIYEEKQPARF